MLLFLEEPWLNQAVKYVPIKLKIFFVLLAVTLLWGHSSLNQDELIITDSWL